MERSHSGVLGDLQVLRLDGDVAHLGGVEEQIAGRWRALGGIEF